MITLLSRPDKSHLVHFGLCLALSLLIGSTQVSAQYYSSTNSKAIKQYEKGVAALQQSNGTEAVKCFEQALQADPNFVEIYLTLGDWYLSTANYPKATANYQTFLQKDQRHKDWRADAEKGMQIAHFRQEQLAHPVAFEPKNLGPTVNSRDDEYLPTLTVDGKTLIFTRRFPRKPTTTANSPEEEDFYTSTRKSDDDVWSQAVRMAEPVNSTDNEGAQCISQDGRVMFFTACGRKDGAGRCDLYMCTNKGGTWSRPRNMGPAVNTGSWESQPSFSIDGKTLYFVSDRKGGYGGKDIWKTVYENGKWSAPQNLGPTINTRGDEMSPFIHYDDHTLYFSSNGHIGMGGLDLFRSTMSDTGWTTPVNLGYPINTDGDESGLIVDPRGTTAIYASERPGGYGGQDLYHFALPSQFCADPTEHVRGYVYDKKTNKRIKTTIQVIDISSGKEVAVVGSDAQDGSYMVSLPVNKEYAFHVSADGYLFYSENFDLSEGLQKDASGKADFVYYERNIALSPIELGESIVLNNVFFETAKYTLLDDSKVELDKVVDILKKNPTLHIELGGHTDNVGQAADNQILSERRAKAVFDYLVAQGIAADRITYKGYGDTKPVADNRTAEGRRLNRRTVFTVMGL